MSIGAFAVRHPLLERREKLTRLEYRVIDDLPDVPSSDRHRQHFRLESPPMTRRAGPRRHVLLQVFTDELAVGLLEAPLDVRNDPLVVGPVFAAATALALVAEHDPLGPR